jgi:hypothetical protein
MPVRARIFPWLVCGLVLTGGLMTDAIAANPSGEARGFNDFVGYWSASRLLVSGRNPYSAAALLELQRSLGLDLSSPLVMFSPPWLLSLTWPFAFLDYPAAQFLWLLLHTYLILFVAQRLWVFYGNPAADYRTAWLVALTFLPLDIAVISGQISPFMLIGLLGFLVAVRKRSWFLAGTALGLIALKPHLLYLYWLTLILWVAQSRCWRIVLGALVAGAALVTGPLLIDPSLFSEYVKIWQLSGVPTPYDWAVPTVGHLLRITLDRNDPGLLFLTSAIGVTFMVFYWRRRKEEWCWSKKLPLILIASLSSCAYMWTFDLALALPAVFQAAAWLRSRPSPFYNALTTRLYVTINGLHLLMRLFVINEFWYFWMGPALLINYLVFQKESGADRPGAVKT